MIAAAQHFIYRGGGREVIPDDLTHISIDESITKIPAELFRRHHLVELICHPGVDFIGVRAFYECSSLKRAKIPGVKQIGSGAFGHCYVLTDVECEKLERIGEDSFQTCVSLRSINLLSIKLVSNGAFSNCQQLRNATFSEKLLYIGDTAFFSCKSLHNVTIPLKTRCIYNDVFRLCTVLSDINLVESKVLNETAAALLREEWRDDMTREIDSINHILPNARAGTFTTEDRADSTVDGEKAKTIQEWMTSVLRKVIHYKAEHKRSLEVTATVLQPFLPSDMVMENVIFFLELPSHRFEGEEEVEDDNGERKRKIKHLTCDEKGI